MWNIEIWQSEKDKQWYWHLISANHKIIASSEGHTRKSNCEKTASDVCYRMMRCSLRYRKVEPKKKNKCPHDHKFGVDIDEHKACGTCDVWNECDDMLCTKKLKKPR